MSKEQNIIVILRRKGEYYWYKNEPVMCSLAVQTLLDLPLKKLPEKITIEVSQTQPNDNSEWWRIDLSSDGWATMSKPSDKLTHLNLILQTFPMINNLENLLEEFRLWRRGEEEETIWIKL